MKILFNEKGSTLLMVIIMAAVLTVLGTAMLSMTFMNINMKYNDNRAKKTLYYSESGIDEVYALVGSMVEDTLEIAKTDTDIYRRALLAYLQTTAVIIDPDIEPEYVGEVHPFTTLTDPISGRTFQETQGIKDGTEYAKFYLNNGEFVPMDKQLDEIVLGKQLDRHFKKEFMEEFNNKYNVASIVDTSLREIAYQINQVDGLEYNGNPSVVEVRGVITPFNVSAEDSTFIISDINSQFIYENRTEKNIQVDIVVNAPESLYPVKVIDNTIKVEDNPIWQNAFVSNTDIFFTDQTNVTVNGDIYALGSYKNEPTGEPKYDESGIMIDAGEVLVYGDLVTRAYIQTMADSDRLIVRDGLVYCNTLSTTNGHDSSIDIINGNLYTKDDLELNAEKSSINIIGSYYGISDGTVADIPEDEEGQTKHYNSSAIVINAALSDASIKISGEMPELGNLNYLWYNPNLWGKGNVVTNPDKFNANKFDESQAGVWIPGTSYINIHGSGNPDYWPYQTGESVSIKENYVAYSLPMLLGDSKFDDTNTYKETATNGIELVFGETKSTPGEVTYFNYRDKADYLLEVSNYPDYNEDVPIIDIGNVSSLNIQNYKYGLGTIVSNDGINNKLENGPSNPTEFATLWRKIKDDFIYYVYNTSRRIIEEDDYDEAGNYIERNIPFPGDDYNIINDHVHNTTGTTYIESQLVDYVFATELNEQAREILYISNPDTLTSETRKNYRLVGVGAGSSIPNYTNIYPDGATPGYYQGMIITQGDVVIDGDVNFTGSIIAGGKIEVRGGNSTFHNNDEASVKYLARFIRNHTELRKLLLKGSIGKMIVFNEPATVEDVNNSNIKHAYKDLVNIKNWKIN
ncbi:MAG: hypothetical protein CVV02_09860 [Firmicutes bacterium HGW-Firmicutes-7]|nr:MAG: hypothetical protein CVV02_09860 [Firmicutes bacterium HGW-Firmicutes-7]